MVQGGSEPHLPGEPPVGSGTRRLAHHQNVPLQIHQRVQHVLLSGVLQGGRRPLPAHIPAQLHVPAAHSGGHHLHRPALSRIHGNRRTDGQVLVEPAQGEGQAHIHRETIQTRPSPRNVGGVHGASAAVWVRHALPRGTAARAAARTLLKPFRDPHRRHEDGVCAAATIPNRRGRNRCVEGHFAVRDGHVSDGQRGPGVLLDANIKHTRLVLESAHLPHTRAHHLRVQGVGHVRHPGRARERHHRPGQGEGDHQGGHLRQGIGQGAGTPQDRGYRWAPEGERQR
mmetsp:Transcript_46908/g.116915  ORF Transcript_46908/g.116915 Transcript_46908/m.116915 type:complete len:284 (+) Transcript_46908:1547-2398(+)